MREAGPSSFLITSSPVHLSLQYPVPHPQRLLARARQGLDAVVAGAEAERGLYRQALAAAAHRDRERGALGGVAVARAEALAEVRVRHLDVPDRYEIVA